MVTTTPLPVRDLSPVPLHAEQTDETLSSSEKVMRASSMVEVTSPSAFESVRALGAGLVTSMVKSRVRIVEVFPALSVARPRIRYVPSAGKLLDGKGKLQVVVPVA